MLTKDQLEKVSESKLKCAFSCNYLHTDELEKSRACEKNCVEDLKQYFKIENLSSACAILSIVCFVSIVAYSYSRK
jgi:hypothetical protein